MSSAEKASQFQNINLDRMVSHEDTGADAYEYADNENDNTINR